jgi:zinc protease
MNLEFYGYPADWYSRYPSLVHKVTAADVARVAKQYVTPDKTSLLVVGNPKGFDQPLTTLGTVTPIDITIPEPGMTSSSGPAKPAAGNAEGMALLKKVQDFAGGKAKIDAVQAVRYVQSATQKTPQGDMEVEVEQTVVFPDRVYSVMKTPMGEMRMVSTAEASFMVVPGMGTRDMPGSQRDNLRAQAKQDMLTILKYPERYTFAAAGTEKIGNVDARILEVTIDGDTARWFIDPATGRVLRKVSRGRSPMVQGDVVTEYTDWKSFGGLMFPVGTKSTNNGEQLSATSTKSVEVNPAVDVKQFERPAA